MFEKRGRLRSLPHRAARCAYSSTIAKPEADSCSFYSTFSLSLRHCSTRVANAHERERDDVRARGRARVRVQSTAHDRPTLRHGVLGIVARRVEFLRALQTLETRASAV